jgi:hypothetical protein
MTAFVANTNVLELSGLKNAIEGTSIDDATVIVTVKDSDGVALTGATWPLTMDPVSGTPGLYRTILPHTLAAIARTWCYAHIDVDAGVNRKGHWEFPIEPQTRTKK